MNEIDPSNPLSWPYEIVEVFNYNGKPHIRMPDTGELREVAPNKKPGDKCRIVKTIPTDEWLKDE